MAHSPERSARSTTWAGVYCPSLNVVWMWRSARSRRGLRARRRQSSVKGCCRGMSPLANAVEDAVDEGARVGAPEALGKFYGHVDGDARLGPVHQLVGAQPEDVAVHDGHAIQPPVRRRRFDPPV